MSFHKVNPQNLKSNHHSDLIITFMLHPLQKSDIFKSIHIVYIHAVLFDKFPTCSNLKPANTSVQRQSKHKIANIGTESPSSSASNPWKFSITKLNTDHQKKRKVQSRTQTKKTHKNQHPHVDHENLYLINIHY